MVHIIVFFLGGRELTCECHQQLVQLSDIAALQADQALLDLRGGLPNAARGSFCCLAARYLCVKIGTCGFPNQQKKCTLEKHVYIYSGCSKFLCVETAILREHVFRGFIAVLLLPKSAKSQL